MGAPDEFLHPYVKPMLTKTQTGYLKLVAAAVIIYLLNEVSAIYLPILLAMVISFVLNPVVDFFVAVPIWPFHRHLPRGVATLLSFVCAAILVTIIAVFLFTPFIIEFYKFLADLPSLIFKLKMISIEFEKNTHNVEIPDNIHNIIDQVLNGATAYTIDLAKRMLNTAFSVASGAVELVVVPVLTYYFLKDWRFLKGDLLAVFPGETRHKAKVIIDEMAEVVSQYIRGQILVSIVIGLMVFAGMYLMGVQYPMVLGLLAMLTETIPIVGPIVGSLPAILLAYATAPALALKVIIFYLMIHQLENHVVVPKIMGHSIALHPVIIIISLLVGGKLFGIAGMILAVPVAALLRVLVRHLWHRER